jgi:hypothetical protein
VARGTQDSIGTLVGEKYFSHCLSQLNGSSPAKAGKSILGPEMDRLNWVVGSLLLWCLGCSGGMLCGKGMF